MLNWNRGAESKENSIHTSKKCVELNSNGMMCFRINFPFILQHLIPHLTVLLSRADEVYEKYNIQIGCTVQKKKKKTHRKNKSIRARDICEKLDYMASFRPVVNATAYYSHQTNFRLCSLHWKYCVFCLYVSREDR